MDPTNEIFRRIDSVEKRLADNIKEVKALKEEVNSLKASKPVRTTSATPKKVTSTKPKK